MITPVIKARESMKKKPETIKIRQQTRCDFRGGVRPNSVKKLPEYFKYSSQYLERGEY